MTACADGGKTPARDIGHEAPSAQHCDAVPMGLYKGLPASIMPTQYLLWVASQEGIRAKHPKFILTVLDILRDRLLNRFDDVLKELVVTETPAQVWQRRKRHRAAQKAAAKADKDCVI